MAPRAPQPAYRTKVPDADVRRGDGAQVASFIETYCRQVKDSIAGRSGDLLKLRPWQRRLVGELYARRPDGRRRHRTGLIGVPRKNGKSAFGSALALDGLLAGPNGAEVYSAGADKEQARIVFNSARRMVELDPDLSEVCRLYRDAIELPATGGVYRVLSAEAYTKEGLSPTLVIYDELHAAPNPDLWNVLALAMGARVDPLLVAITTAGVRTDTTGLESVAYRLFQHGTRVAAGELDDPTFYFLWYAARPNDPHDRPATWRRANPGYGDLVDPEDFASAVVRTPEAEFRTKRLNQWVGTASTWLPAGAWDRCADPDRTPDPTNPEDADLEVVLGFDGSWSRDCTAIVAATVEDTPHLWPVALWERPTTEGAAWHVPVAEVRQALRDACTRWHVRTIACDPHRWADTIDDLEAEGLPILSWPTHSAARMVPACSSFYDAVINGRLTHDADPAFARHLGNAQVKRDQAGVRIVKDHKDSPRKIDLAVAAVVAYAEAIAARQAPPPPDVAAAVH